MPRPAGLGLLVQADRETEAWAIIYQDHLMFHYSNSSQ